MLSNPDPNQPRAFGLPDDLGVEFDTDDRPALVSALLSQCTAPQEAGYWWAQSVGQRIAALLRLLRATVGEPNIELESNCTRPGCAAPFEFSLPIEGLTALAGADAPIAIQLGGGRQIVLRRPTGDDLRAWRSGLDPARNDALQSMLESLRLRGAPRADDAAAVGQALAEHDPLVDFSVACTCPACGAAVEVAVDLEALALRRLRLRQRELLREVHAFALHYGWTEAQILALPESRRAAYLAMIEGSP